MRARRLKVVRFRQSDVLDMMAGAMTGFPGHVSLPVVRDAVPDGATVHSVFYDPLNRCFDFLVEHSSFDNIEEGSPAPLAITPMVWQAVRVPLQPLPRPAMTFPDADVRVNGFGWAVWSVERGSPVELARFPLESLAREYCRFVRGEL